MHTRIRSVRQDWGQSFRIERFINLMYLNTVPWYLLPEPRTPFPIFVNSVPKSGTNLLMKALGLFPTVRDSKISLHSEMVGSLWRPTQPVWQQLWRLFPSVRSSYKLAKSALASPTTHDAETKFIPIGGFHEVFVPDDLVRSTLSHVKPGWFAAGHMPFSCGLDRIMRDQQYKMVVIIRDPRDVIYSELKFFLNTKRLVLHKFYRQLSMDQGLMSVIQGIAPSPGFPGQPDIREVMQDYLAWCSQPYVLVTKFENLVGPQGGGDVRVQLNEISKIADHLEISLTSDEAKYIATNLFGGTHTFRKGVIGSWRQALKPEHRSAVKKRIGDLLVELGYEKDVNW